MPATRAIRWVNPLARLRLGRIGQALHLSIEAGAFATRRLSRPRRCLLEQDRFAGVQLSPLARHLLRAPDPTKERAKNVRLLIGLG
jgi:hypothetical protein